MKNRFNCSGLNEYLAAVAAEEGYRNIRELLCNYTQNFGYGAAEFKLHMEWVYGVHYSTASYRQIFYNVLGTTKRAVALIKKRKKTGFKYFKTECRYMLVTKYCLGYRTFREALYCLIKKEGLNFRQIAGLYGVSKGALQYRIKQERRIKSRRTF